MSLRGSALAKKRVAVSTLTDCLVIGGNLLVVFFIAALGQDILDYVGAAIVFAFMCNLMLRPEATRRSLLEKQKLCDRDRIIVPEIEMLAKLANIPAPHVYIKNGFRGFAATGLSRAGVILLGSAPHIPPTPRELLGVYAHEIAHLKYNDWLKISCVLFVLVPEFAFMILHNFTGIMQFTLALCFFSTVAVSSWILIGRSQEYRADATSALLTGGPIELAEYLEKLDMEARFYGVRTNIGDRPNRLRSYA